MITFTMKKSWAVWTTVLRPVNQHRCSDSLCMYTHTLSCCSCSLHTVMWVKPEGLHRVVRLQSRLCSDSDVQSSKPLLPFGPLLFHRSPLTVLVYVWCCSLAAVSLHSRSRSALGSWSFIPSSTNWSWKATLGYSKLRFLEDGVA